MTHKVHREMLASATGALQIRPPEYIHGPRGQPCSNWLAQSPRHLRILARALVPPENPRTLPRGLPGGSASTPASREFQFSAWLAQIVASAEPFRPEIRGLGERTTRMSPWSRPD